jgi:uncharacterized SAM-binding protein YcdF (DUF218 family)
VLRLLIFGSRLIIAVIGTWALLVAAIYLYGSVDRARGADVIVVLGAAHYDGRPSPVLRARVDHAIDLYERDLAPRVIFTGGVGVGDTVSEARVAARYAAAQGIPESAIVTELTGVRTRESMVSVREIMDAEGLETAILVSDPFHMLRLRLIALRLGIRSYESPTRTSPISADRRRELRHVLRESYILPFSLIGDS